MGKRLLAAVSAVVAANPLLSPNTLQPDQQSAPKPFSSLWTGLDRFMSGRHAALVHRMSPRNHTQKLAASSGIADMGIADAALSNVTNLTQLADMGIADAALSNVTNLTQLVFPPGAPPPPFSPPSPPPEQLSVGNTTVNVTGDARVDAHNAAVIAERRLLQNEWLPMITLAAVLLLFAADTWGDWDQGFYRSCFGCSCCASWHPDDGPKAVRLTLSMALFMVCSAGMTIFNKLALVVVPLPLVLVSLQMLITVVGVLAFSAVAAAGNLSVLRAGSSRDILRWLPVPVLFSGSVTLFMASLLHASVSAVVTWRNLAPLAAMFVECCCFSQARYRSSCHSVFGLLVIVAGVGLYGTADMQFSGLATTLIVGHTAVTVAETLLRRHLLVDRLDPLSLTLSSMLLLNNGIGMLVLSIAALCLGQWHELARIISLQDEDGIDSAEAFYIASSIVCSALYNYAGLKIAALITTTSLLVATNAAKMCVVVFGVFFLADEHSATAILGCSLAVFGNLIYYMARIQAVAQHPGEGIEETSYDSTRGTRGKASDKLIAEPTQADATRDAWAMWKK